jgi:hypothetical protein
MPAAVCAAERRDLSHCAPAEGAEAGCFAAAASSACLSTRRASATRSSEARTPHVGLVIVGPCAAAAAAAAAISSAVGGGGASWTVRRTLRENFESFAICFIVLTSTVYLCRRRG